MVEAVAVIEKQPEKIQRMFAEIAPRYDRANRILSMRFDVRWRKLVARTLLPAPGRVLDVAAGTGDLSIDLRHHGKHNVIPSDFTYEMLWNGCAKYARGGLSRRATCADALRLPFRDSTFDGVTVAFGIRNFADPLAGLREMTRVIRRGGAAGVLEFSTPSRPFNHFYQWYFRHVLPTLGGAITGSKAPYEYLPASVGEFPQGDAFLKLMSDAGLENLSAKRLTFGICTFYRGEKR